MTKTTTSASAAAIAAAAAAGTPPSGDTSSVAPAGETRILGGGAEALRATAEEVQVSRDRNNEPTSASIEPRAATLGETFGLPRQRRATRAVSALVATSLPARTRVLPSGLHIPAHPSAVDAGEERLFTAVSKILRSKVLYDIGAPVPLTRAEFLTKRQLAAIEEQDFEDGEDAPESLIADGMQAI